MPSRYEALAVDILGAISAIRTFTQDCNAAEYLNSQLISSACERQLEIVGEAMTRLRDQHPDRFDQISRGSSIIGLRNRLIHGYDAVDSAIVWDVLVTKLDAIERDVQRMLETR